MANDIFNVININVYKNGSVGSKNVVIGNKYENNVTLVHFNLEDDLLNDGFKYYYILLKSPKTEKNLVYPLNNYSFIVSNAISSEEGVWLATIVVKDAATMDPSCPYQNAIFISNQFGLEVEDNFVGYILSDETEEMDPNLKLLYDDLLILKAWFEEAIKNDYYRGPQGLPGENGHSPYIGENGNWYEYSDIKQEYYDTGVSASGFDGDLSISTSDIHDFEPQVRTIIKDELTVINLI